MENNKIVRYEELTTHFKRKVMLKHHHDRKNSLKTFSHEGETCQAIPLWYEGVDYLVLIDDNSLSLIEWGSFQETEFEEELDSFNNFKYSDEFLDDLGNLFYS
ncbi:MAG: hypothetical protein P8I55_11245 [Crocinitomix sp.]|nr:hypothetical protein [Crocinitomix sp.]